ncbi:hypothetical protein [Streptomyces africanus]|uniref:hypothetical protein n=1 Tax=Streptomyces africanus TaxID=231024 RepID=UPI000A37561E|nr:hypothetical protein [Streptomyces africanus]
MDAVRRLADAVAAEITPDNTVDTRMLREGQQDGTGYAPSSASCPEQHQAMSGTQCEAGSARCRPPTK